MGDGNSAVGKAETCDRSIVETSQTDGSGEEAQGIVNNQVGMTGSQSFDGLAAYAEIVGIKDRGGLGKKARRFQFRCNGVEQNVITFLLNNFDDFFAGVIRNVNLF